MGDRLERRPVSMAAAPEPLRVSLRARLLGGASNLAFPAASMALVVGVSLASGASAQTVIPNQTATYNLNPANNPFLVNSGTTVSDPAGNAIYGGGTAHWTLTNNGAVTGAGGIYLQSQSTVTNAGTITAGGNGVDLGNGGIVTNQAGGAISGGALGDSGVVVATGAGTVTNAGTITGTSGGGVGLGNGGIVANQAGGVISGANYGVGVSGGAGGTVTNAGTITGTSGGGVDLRNGGIVANQAGGMISGANYGVGVSGGAGGTVTNAGTITGTSGGGGVDLGNGGIVANQAGGMISGRYGVYLGGGGSVTNQTGGTINGIVSGVNVYGGAGQVINAGTIKGNGYGVFLGAGGSVTNQGMISGGSDGVFVAGTGSVTNQAKGVIGGYNGVYVTAGTVTNAGTIMGTGTHAFGVELGNGGSVTNQAGGVISGGQEGVWVVGPASMVTNAGTITGGSYSVLFQGTGANTLILQTGSMLNGTAAGSTAGGATNALVLQGSGTANNGFVHFTTLDVQASGTWTLNSSSAIGATTIDSGTLAIGDAGHPGATLTSPVSVNAGGTLAGDGTVIGNVTVANAGAVQGGLPGTIGALQVNGNLTFNSGGILATTIAPSGASLVNVTGTATLRGGIVQVTASTFITHTETFTILTATNISGAFTSDSVVGTVGTAFARNPRLSENANDVFLTVDAGSFAAALPASATSNQISVAKGIDAGLAGGALPAGFLTLGNLPVANLPNALTQLSGETATGSQQTTFDAMTQFMGLLLDPFIGGRGDASTSASGATPYAEDGASAYAPDGKPRSKNERDAYAAIYRKAPGIADTFTERWSVWAAGYGGSQTTDGNAAVGSNTATSRIAGTAVGADYRFSPFTIAGFALSGGGTNFSVANGGTGRSDLFQAGAFIRHTVGPAYISAALAYGWQDITTDRTVTVAGVDQLRAEFNANAWSGRVEGGYRFVTPWMGGIGITPYAAGQFTTFDLPSYAESALAGSSTFALAYNAKDVTDSRSELGVRTDKSFALSNAILTLRGRAAWAYDFNPDRSIAATFQALPGASFVVNGAAQAYNSALTTASAELKWMNGWSAAVTFEGEFSDVTQSYAGKGVVRYTW
jgi:uncharacterized protein with beta-barrel porin domain